MSCDVLHQSNIISVLNECKKLKGRIIPTICEILDGEDIVYDVNKEQSVICIDNSDNKLKKEEIIDKLMKHRNIEKKILTLLIYTILIDNCIYIYQKRE